MIKDKLNSMIGNMYNYRGRQLTIQGWSSYDGIIEILNNGHAIQINKSDINKALKEFKTVNNPAGNGALPVKTEKLEPIEDILINTIDKLKKEPGYVEQAKAINSSVTNLINIQKLKLQMLKEIRKNNS